MRMCLTRRGKRFREVDAVRLGNLVPLCNPMKQRIEAKMKDKWCGQ